MQPSFRLVCERIIISKEGGGSGKELGSAGLQQYCERLIFDMVPIVEVGDQFNYTLSELLEKAKGNYSSSLDKEGIVVRA